jgi:hypothetical protein
MAMAGVHGEQLYGQVDRVSGLFYVSTLFFHVNYVPLVPLRSYVVLEGSEKGGAFHGKKVPLHLKSVAVGYLRGWTGVATICLAAASGFLGTTLFLNGPDAVNVLAALAVAAALCWCFWFAMTSRRRVFLWVEMALLVLASALWIVEQNLVPAPAPGEIAASELLLLANAAALVFNFTRLLSPARRERALVLAAELGIAPEAIAAHFDDEPAAMDEPSALPPPHEDELGMAKEEG